MSSLTLSGGGFRATFFHLGVINYLRTTGQLEGVERIYSVSGGSILAAHLVLNWANYKSLDSTLFDPIAGKLVKFAQRDLRGRVIRRWMLCWLCAALLCLVPINVLPYFQPFGLGLGGSLGVGLACLVIGGAAVYYFRLHWSRIKWLEREYGWLFPRNRLDELLRPTGAPVLHLLSTDLTSADFFSFSGDGIRIVLTNPVTNEPFIKPFGSTDLSVALAVAASSAYPALFPPVRVTPGMIEASPNEMPDAHYLADGGVYENLGTRARRRLDPNDTRPLVVSDAQRETGTLFKEGFGSLLTRTVRTTDILMKRVNEFENAALTAPPSFQPIRLQLLPPIHSQDVPGNEQPLNELVQRRLLKVRTDLDAFSPAEVQLLIYQGYAAAVRAYDTGAAIAGFQFTQGHMPFPLPQRNGKWLPYAIGNKRVDPDALHALRRSDRTKKGLLAWNAPLFYVNFLLLFPLLLLGLLYPSLMGWAWLENFLPSRVQACLPHEPSKVIFNEMAHETALIRLALTCGDVPGHGEAVYYRAGPFNTSGSRPIDPFIFRLHPAEGYKLISSSAFLLSAKQGRRYRQLQAVTDSHEVSVRVLDSQGDESLLLILCVQREVGSGALPDATDLFPQSPEVNP